MLHLITIDDTLVRTPLDEGSARCRDLYLTAHTNKRHTSMPPGGIRTRNPSKRVAADLRLRPRGHWNRQYTLLPLCNRQVYRVYITLCKRRPVKVQDIEYSHHRMDHTRIWERSYWCSLKATVVSTAIALKECRAQKLYFQTVVINQTFLFSKNDIFGLSH